MSQCWPMEFGDEGQLGEEGCVQSTGGRGRKVEETGCRLLVVFSGAGGC